MEKVTDRIIKKFTSRMQAKLLLVFCVITLVLLVLMGKLIYIQQVDGNRYGKKVLSSQTYMSSVLPFKRGDILDVNGTVLAHSELQYRLILDPKRLRENKECIEPTIDALKKDFKIKSDEINKILKDKPNSQYVVLAKNLKYDVVQAFKKDEKENSKIDGIWFEEEYVRTYPYKTLAPDVIGFSNADNKGFYGIEEYYNEELNGTNGREYGYYDSKLDIDHTVKEAVNGNTIVTTINADIQRIIQKKIIEFNNETGSKGIQILVMNPNDGSIIAMASNKEYDLNNPFSLTGLYSEEQIKSMSKKKVATTLQTIWKNDIISSNFEPGSTFKPITVASALEEGLVTDKSTFICDGGEKRGNRFIRCSHIHKNITLGEAIMKSCNDTMMQIAKHEGKQLFYEYEQHFGIGQKTGIDLPGEEAGLILSLDQLGEQGLATSSFGQSTSVPMIQMAAAYCSIVNGGNYYQPHVMKKIVNDNGATVKEIDKILVRKTISEKTSKLLQEYLYKTVAVAGSTATGAEVTGYSIGGKTGTAEKKRGTKARVVSFLGSSPAINPKIVFYVAIDEAKVPGKQTSGLATEFASKVLNEILPVLGIYPDGDIDYLISPTPTPKASSDDKNNKSKENNQTASGTETTKQTEE